LTLQNVRSLFFLKQNPQKLRKIRIRTEVSGGKIASSGAAIFA
jgi:hypothetical protein